jgi:hypothetical protein
MLDLRGHRKLLPASVPLWVLGRLHSNGQY